MSLAQDLKYDPAANPDAPYVYRDIRYTKELMQRKLFNLVDRTEEFFKVLDFFKLDINYREERFSSSYLIAAASTENWTLVESLINRGIDVNGREQRGSTALMHAAFCGHTESVRLLLSKGADPTIQFQDAKTAADLAQEGQEEATCSGGGDYKQTISLLTKAINGREGSYQDLKYDPEHYATTPYLYKGIGYTKDLMQLKLFGLFDKPEEFFKVLDFFKLDINYQNKISNSSYLIMAASEEKWSLIESLIDRKINVNLRDSGGATALMYVAVCGHVESVRLLLSAGTNPYLTTYMNKNTAVDLAKAGQQNNRFYCRYKGDYKQTIEQLLKFKLI